MKLGPKALAPLLALLAGLLFTTALVAVRPAPVPREANESAPLVHIVVARPGTVQPWVAASGTVVPRIESDLVAEVAGRVVWVSPHLDAGAYFDADEELLRIEPRDYEVAAERARAAVERAESQLALATATRARMEALRARGASSPARLEEAVGNARIAAANLRDARAQLSQADLDLSRTRVTAPFAGRVRARTAEPGQFVSPGHSLARIFTTDVAEVRLPVPAGELAFLDPGPQGRGPTSGPGAREPETPGPSTQTPAGARVVLHGTSGGRAAEWHGRVVRTEGMLDEQTRMLHVVARVPQPDSPADGPPLTMGLFVEARIEGRPIADIVEIPRASLRPGGEVLLVDADSRLRRRHVEVLRLQGERAWISDGLAAGERVCTTPPAVFVEGMGVRIAEADAP